MPRWFLTASLAGAALLALLLPQVRSAMEPILTATPIPVAPEAPEAPGRGRTLVVLLDTSGSMVNADREPLTRGILSTVRPEDKVALVTFSDEARNYGWFGGGQLETVKTLLETAPVGGGSNLSEGVEMALSTFPESGGDLWVVTDGDPNVGSLDGESFRDLGRRAERHGVRIHHLGAGEQPYVVSLLEAPSR